MAYNWEHRTLLASFLTAIVLVVYLYPYLRARSELGASDVPPIFAPDLTLYLNLSNLTPLGEGLVENPYYRIPVPANGAGYLKFGLAAKSFRQVEKVVGHRNAALVLWNSFWWACLCISAIWIFRKFLPSASQWLVAMGVCLLMFFNFGVTKTLILAWAHLPSVTAFEAIGLPFMRAFVPVIPCALVLLYLGLQMNALQKRQAACWMAMVVLQLLALAVFPYATLLMAGITAVSVIAQVGDQKRRAIWRTALLYATVCAVLDYGFLLRGSVGFYQDRSPAIHLQPRILPHLIGWNWAAIVLLTFAVALNKRIRPQVKWPLAGLGAANALLMLGDAIVPATKILLSHHAGHFVHTTIAVLLTFVAAAALSSYSAIAPRQARFPVILVCSLALASGILTASATYRGTLGFNREIMALSRSQNLWNPDERGLIIASSKTVDDYCGWVPLLATSPVLFCTDAEVMLTPQQDRDDHRVRQALYLYFTGEDSAKLERELSSPDPSALMYRLGYWAEAVSNSPGERQQGISQIEADLIPQLVKVEAHDAALAAFFRSYARIVVIDKPQDRAFDPQRLTSFFEPDAQKDVQRGATQFVISFYRPR